MTLTPELRPVPIAEIDAAALPRDRTRPCPVAHVELRDSICRHGLRMPVELWRLSEPRLPHRYGLISGWRRLAVFREMSGHTAGAADWAAIPAFVRPVESLPRLLTAVAEENAVRDGISPWERGAFILRTVEEDAFATIEQAADALFPTVARSARARLRSLARVVEAMEGRLSAPETLTLRQLLRIDAACRKGFADDLGHALAGVRGRTPALQREAIEPVLREAEAEAPDTPLSDPRIPPRRGRPRRIVDVRPGLRIRRESMPGGYRLHFTGPAATAALVQEIMDEVERLWGRE